jgi:rhodanese-related sulfurtransferase
MPALPLEISVSEAKQILDSNPNVSLIDCREPFEHAICQIAGSQLLPMGQIPTAIAGWAGREGERMLVICHHGVRSLRVVQFLHSHGFVGAQSLQGGIEAWSQEIDPTLPRY